MMTPNKVIAMSAIAKILLEMGHNVSGSDLEPNSLTKELKSLGAAVFQGHSKTNLPKGVKKTSLFLIILPFLKQPNFPSHCDPHQTSDPLIFLVF